MKFLDLVNDVVQRISERPGFENLSDREFEEVVVDELKKNAKIDIEKVEYQPGSTSFPDIKYETYGIEVKTSKKSWTSLGNSIMEGTRRVGVESIYVVFLNKDALEIKVGKYEDCLSDIKVTHSPRYEINMELGDSPNVFDKIEEDYEDFRVSKDKVKTLKKYVLEKGEKGSYPWWIDEESGVTSTSFEIKNFASLSPCKKEYYRVEIMCCFPETLSGNYGAAAIYLCTKYGYYNKSFRDLFSSGGRVNKEYQGRFFDCPAAVGRAIDSLGQIKDFFENNPKLILEAWEKVEQDEFLFDRWINYASASFRSKGLQIYEGEEPISLRDLFLLMDEKK
ncbi:hypothetical protein [Desulfuromonas sp.]|uniref:hypothetical protein n=1 Tax=Desulfuromonas sp. TaxID=892 RepID=UPI0025C02DA4|nr:hypothetical protein [Desulfuromonas sp.]